MTPARIPAKGSPPEAAPESQAMQNRPTGLLDQTELPGRKIIPHEIPAGLKQTVSCVCHSWGLKVDGMTWDMCISSIHPSMPAHVKAERVDPSSLPISSGSLVSPADRLDVALWALHFSKPNNLGGWSLDLQKQHLQDTKALSPSLFSTAGPSLTKLMRCGKV